MKMEQIECSETSAYIIQVPMKMEQIECSETSAYIIQTPGKYPKENIIQVDVYCCVGPQAARDVTGALSVRCG